MHRHVPQDLAQVCLHSVQALTAYAQVRAAPVLARVSVVLAQAVLDLARAVVLAQAQVA